MLNKNYFNFFIFIFICFACQKNKTTLLVSQIPISTNEDIHDVIFINDSVGYLCGGNRFLKSIIFETKDKGNTWQEKILDLNSQQKALYSIATNANGSIAAVGFGGAMQISNDTGKTFHYQQHYYWNEYRGITFTSKDSMLVCGGDIFNIGYYSKIDTTGKINPNNIIDSTNFKLWSVQFQNNKIGYICGYGCILKTIDGGITWSYTAADGDFFRQLIWKNNLGLAIGFEGSILKTTDNAATWLTIRDANVPLKKKYHFNAIAAIDDNRYIIVGNDGLVLISKNLGEDWEEIDSFTSSNLTKVTVLNDFTILIVGEQGSIFKCKL